MNRLKTMSQRVWINNNNRKLNVIIKKNRYSISLITETIARLFKAKWMIKINIRHAFNRIRLHSKENENLITFRTKYETYKYLIMSFELINDSFIFQNFMNDILMNYLDEFVIVYLNDIIVYSNSKKKHIRHVRKVLQRLREVEIQADVNKCEFHITEIKFLNMIIERDDIKMNSEKIKAIVEWNTSHHLKDVQAFVKFVNFYKRFIKNFFKIVKSLIKLIRKNQSFHWSKDCQIAFEQLKKRVIETLVLSYFSSELETFLESNSFDYVSIEVLSQKENDDHIKSVAYFSKTLSSAECNYEIYDKKLLTIIKCFEQWRVELQSMKSSTNVLIDHKSLKYFMITKKLNKRQTKWAEFLAEFDFKIAYQSKKKNDKADALTRRLDDRSDGDDDSNDRNKHMHQTILSAEKIDSRIVQELNDTEEKDSKLSLFDRVKSVNQKNATCTIIRDAIRNRKKFFDEMLLKKFESIEDTLFFKKKLWIFESDELKLSIIREIHDQSASEHSDVRRTCKYLSRWYYWSQVKQSIERYIRNCHICKRFKVIRDKYFDLLNSLSISNRSWTNIIMNFVIELSESKNFNAILMMINRLTKMHHYISCTTTEESINVEKTTRLLINYVWKLHELSNTIVFDRDSQFISLIWKSICERLKINIKLSTAFHFETDDQSEIANQKMKRYLRSYCNYQQDDWSEWLSMIEFVFNAATSASTELFVFMTNYDFEFRMSFDSSNSKDDVSQERLSTKERMLTQKAAIIAKKMKNIWDFTKKKLANAQDTQKKHANQKRSLSSEYELEDLMWLFTKNIKIERSFRKLNHKWIESYKIKKILKDACQFDLSQSMKIHDIFHIFLLRIAVNDFLTDQIQSSSSSIVIDDEKEEYEVNDILNSRYHYEKLQYRVAWIDHLSDRAWYSAENFQNHSKEILDDYHRKYSEKLESKLRLIVIIEAMLSQWIRNEHRETK